MLNDGISIEAIVAVNLHDNHIISHLAFTVQQLGFNGDKCAKLQPGRKYLQMKNRDIIEKVQRHFTKRFAGMNTLQYEEKLRSLNVPSLAYKRIRGDLI